MSINQGILIEIERETANTKRILANINDSHLEWTPHPKSMPMGRLIGHIVELHNWVNKALHSSTFDLGSDYLPFAPASIAQALEALDGNYELNTRFVEKMSDEDWQKSWTIKFGDHVIGTMPKIAAIRFVIYNHLIHHRGQLSVYLRLLDIPVPGLYGPSADDVQG